MGRKIMPCLTRLVLCLRYAVLLVLFFCTVLFSIRPAEAADKKTVVVIAESANLREEPSVESKMISWASKGVELPVIDEFTETSGKKWYKVKTSDNKRLWVADKVVRVAVSKKAESGTPKKPEQKTDSAKKEIRKEQPAADIKNTDSESVPKDMTTPVIEIWSAAKMFREILDKGKTSATVKEDIRGSFIAEKEKIKTGPAQNTQEETPVKNAEALPQKKPDAMNSEAVPADSKTKSVAVDRPKENQPVAFPEIWSPEKMLQEIEAKEQKTEIAKGDVKVKAVAGKEKIKVPEDKRQEETSEKSVETSPQLKADDKTVVAKSAVKKGISKGTTLIVISASAALRAEPSLNSEALTWASKGTVLSVLDEFTELTGKKWYKVKTSKGKKLWIVDKVVRLSEPKLSEIQDAVKKSPSDVAGKDGRKDQQAASAKSTDAPQVKSDDKAPALQPADDEKMLQQLLDKANGYFKEGKCEDFISVNLKALDLVEKLRDRYTEGKLHYNISECYTRLKKYDDTIKHLDSAADIGQRTGNAELEILAMIDKSRVLVIMGDKKNASGILKAASEKADRQIFLTVSSEDYLKALISFQTGGVLFSLGEKEKAKEKLDYSLTLNPDFRQEEDIITLLKTVDVPVYEQISSVNKTLDEAWSAYEKGEYKNMEKLVQKAFDVAKRLSYKRGIFGCNYYLAMASISMDRYDSAVDYALRAQESAEKGNDRMRLGMVYNLTGNIFKQRKAYDKALYYYSKNLEISGKMGNREGEAVTLNNIGNVLMDKSEYKDALRYYEDSLKIGIEIGIDKYLISQDHLSIGIARKKTGDYIGAEKSIVTAMGMFREMGNAGGELVCIWELAGNYALLGEYRTAVKLLEENLGRAEKVGLKKSFVDDLIVYAEKNKDFLKAEKYRMK